MSDEIYIGDLPSGTEITLMTYAKNGEPVSLQTVALEGSKDKLTLYVQPMKSGDKYLLFKNLNVAASVIYNSKMYYFNLDAVTIVKYRGAAVHALICKAPKASTNRREHVRVQVGADAEVQMEGYPNKQMAFVHDISCSGIGINIQGEHEYETGSNASISFEVQQGAEKVQYNGIHAKLIHNQYDSKTRFTKLGLWFIKEYPKISNLVAYVQREELKKITHDRRQ